MKPPTPEEILVLLTRQADLNDKVADVLEELADATKSLHERLTTLESMNN